MAANIERLCTEWRNAMQIPGGGMQVYGPNTEKFRLLANEVKFHELDHASLCVAIIGLSQVLLVPGLNTVICEDHFFLWSWCAELLLGRYAVLFSRDEREIKSLYEACIRASLVDCKSQTAVTPGFEQQHKIEALQSRHVQAFLRHSSLALAYLTFPLLEAVLKRACRKFISLDGKIVSDFDVWNSLGEKIEYRVKGKKKKCSSLRDLLLLHHTQVAEPQLVPLLEKFKTHLLTIDGAQDPYDLIYAWRNASLHGATNFQTIGGTILNLCLLISVFEGKQEFDQHRLKISESCSRLSATGYRGMWSYYPPY